MPRGSAYIDYDKRKVVTDAFMEGWELGFNAGFNMSRDAPTPLGRRTTEYRGNYPDDPRFNPKRKRKLSEWQKFVKANSKKPRFKYKSGAKKGRINLKALGVAYRKKRR